LNRPHHQCAASQSVSTLGDPHDSLPTRWNRSRHAVADAGSRDQLGCPAKPAIQEHQLDWTALFPRISKVAFALAAAELLGDKMRSAPDRTITPGILARIATGAIAGMAVAPLREQRTMMVSSFPDWVRRSHCSPGDLRHSTRSTQKGEVKSEWRYPSRACSGRWSASYGRLREDPTARPRVQRSPLAD